MKINSLSNFERQHSLKIKRNLSQTWILHFTINRLLKEQVFKLTFIGHFILYTSRI